MRLGLRAKILLPVLIALAVLAKDFAREANETALAHLDELLGDKRLGVSTAIDQLSRIAVREAGVSASATRGAAEASDRVLSLEKASHIVASVVKTIRDISRQTHAQTTDSLAEMATRIQGGVAIFQLPQEGRVAAPARPATQRRPRPGHGARGIAL